MAGVQYHMPGRKITAVILVELFDKDEIVGVQVFRKLI
jgi:hypothetical protein